MDYQVLLKLSASLNSVDIPTIPNDLFHAEITYVFFDT